MRHIVIILLSALLGAFLLTGCQESNTNQIRRARVVADENLEFRKHLEEKDKEIESLKNEIVRLEGEIEKMNEEFGSTTIHTLQMMSETEACNQALTLENEKLKEELKRLKSQ